MKVIRLNVREKSDRDQLIIILAHLKCQVWVEIIPQKTSEEDLTEYWVCFKVPELNIKDM